MISVVLATHNEERNILRCLNSVKDFTDEIIVVDGESTDKTIELAQQFGAKVITTTNKSNFHINKQMAMDAATGDLILQMDADEEVDTELKDFILKIKSNTLTDSTEAVAWYLKRKNFFLGRFLKKGGQYPDPVIRLYKKGFAYLPQKNVHEQMVVKGIVAVAQGHLLHYAFPDFKTYMRKFNTYTSFEAERLHNNEMLPSAQNAFTYFVMKPVHMFLLLFIRHRGYVDGFAGFIFALMSSLHHPFVYLKLQEYYKK